MKKLLLILIASLSLTGCAHLASRTSKTTIDANGKPELTTTHINITTFFDSKSEVAKVRTSVADKTSGTSIGSLNQEASGTNANQLAASIMEGVATALIKSAK